ncbi:hypothetical protein KVT40_009245 [Elsinoe batatas]|uniref:Uncharacterized protein n=1 Tax=Elsinoe batatas TaxID=2601811 RepID=A0A8K0KZ72_9PEZI|nr:hypothetical protein KVT40_009245 [Elsinoe batatas]
MNELPVIGVELDSDKGLFILRTAADRASLVQPTGITRVVPEEIWTAVGPMDHAAILSYRASRECLALATLPLSLELVGKVATDIKLIDMELKNTDFVTICKDENSAYQPSNHPRHVVARVVTFSGASFALDLAGGQFGITDTLLPWDNYVGTYCHHIISTSDLNSNRKDFPTLREPPYSGLMGNRAKMTMQLLEAQEMQYLLQHPFHVDKIDEWDYADRIKAWIRSY